MFDVLDIHFGYAQSTISRIFAKTIPSLANKMKELIIWPEPFKIIQNLTVSFRSRYSNVVAIIACLEIEIERPSNAAHRSSTWFQYKKTNSLKYLTSCTSDGLVNFVSGPFGVRFTDVV